MRDDLTNVVPFPGGPAGPTAPPREAELLKFMNDISIAESGLPVAVRPRRIQDRIERAAVTLTAKGYRRIPAAGRGDG